MNLLAINQFFWPDVAPTGQLLGDVATEIASGGTKVTIICGAAGYAAKSTSVAPHAEIRRSSQIPFSRRAPGRVLSYATFLAGALWNGLRAPCPDVILSMTTPPLTSVLGHFLKLIRGSRHFIWEMDVYPDIAIDLGVLRRNSLLTRTIGVLADWSRRRANGIIVLGEDMKTRLLARGIPAHKIHIAENWADGRCIRQLPLPAGPLTVLYSGNLGKSHDVDTIAAAIRRLDNDPRFRFVFAGGGRRIPNIEFRPYCSEDAISDSLGACHLGLVTQLPATCGSVVPSKTYGILAAGRPVLYIGPREATPARIIDRFACGWRIEPGDVDSLVSLLLCLADDPEAISAAGARARAAFDLYYDRPIGVARVAEILGFQPAQSEHRPHVFPHHPSHSVVPAVVASDALGAQLVPALRPRGPAG